ncbi:glycosyltransferase [Actinomycetospora sp. CA-084318]|uniref:glycosyltransferase n=1 Tax=Actinomycetospora sp. CA-084318 TaxID=3239892 RepID=UPI003D973EDF
MFYSGAERLRTTLDSLRPQVDELTVVDVGPTGEVSRWSPPGVVVIDGSANRGYGWACNLGIAAARGDFVLISNPDVVYEADSVDAMVDVAAREALVAPRQTSRRDSRSATDAFECLQLGISPSASTIRWLNVGRRRFDRRRTAVLRRPDTMLTVPLDMTLSGASLMASRATWERVGGFDERFFLYQEDADLSLRTRSAGVDLVVANEARVFHETGSSRAGLDLTILSWAMASERIAWRSRGLPTGLLTAIQVLGLTARALRELCSGNMRAAMVWWRCACRPLAPAPTAGDGEQERSA